jgi:arginine utilization regulatory protein
VKNNEYFELDYIDSLMIVDHTFKIVNTYRYNVRFNHLDMENAHSDYLGKSYYDAYPHMDERESTMYQCMKYNQIIYRKNQIFKDYKGRVFNTQNVTIPINRGGKTVGVLELSKDITSINDIHIAQKKRTNTPKYMTEIVAEQGITFDDILTSNAEMIENVRHAKIFIKSPNPTLIYGETGTGKEMFVQAMVNENRGQRKGFVAINCAAVPETLLESTLFGSVKGAYTGSVDKVGLFEQAHGGTLFLDELNSMPYDIQAKLLRVLQDNKIRPVGGNKEKIVDVKVVAAMNAEPIKAIQEKKLREDLFYRLSSSMIRLTPLRDRREDILLYTNYFIKQFNNQYGKEVEGLSKSMMDIFMQYHWKGNVRELKHIVENMVSISDEQILSVKSLPIYMKANIDHLHNRNSNKKRLESKAPIYVESLKDTLEAAERKSINMALEYTDGHITRAAELLEIPRQTLTYKMRRLKIVKGHFKR